MNLRLVGIPTDTGLINLRVVDLDDPNQLMTADDRVLGPDGKPLGWSDGLPTSDVFGEGDRCAH
jgi:hypothetical protein